MIETIEVAIVGGGPYGLSIAAHLSALGIDFRIFGAPMHAWQAHMPAGMHLKSDGSSSNLSDPNGEFTLKAFCSQSGYEHHDTERPVSLECFIQYGLAFQKRFVPQLELKLLVSLEKLAKGFRLRFSDGETVLAQRVLLATGIEQFKHMPSFLAGLPPELVSHSSQYGSTANVAQKQVAVLGGGASALDLAALLHEHGVNTSLIVRQPTVEFHGVPGHRATWRRMARPTSGIGNGWRLRIYSGAPQVFHILPERLRRHQIHTLLGPATGWFMKDRIVGRVPMLMGCTPLGAAARDGHVYLAVSMPNGTKQELVVDHVIAATGYRIDLSRLSFMTDHLRSLLRTEGQAPALSSNFESSVPGLFFVGPASMNSFGPVVRFVYGARYTALRISKHLARTRVGTYHAAIKRPAKATVSEVPADPDVAPL